MLSPALLRFRRWLRSWLRRYSDRVTLASEPPAEEHQRFATLRMLFRLLWPTTLRQKIFLILSALGLLCMALSTFAPSWLVLVAYLTGLYFILKRVLGRRVEVLATLIKRGAQESERFNADALKENDEFGSLGRSILDMARQLRRSTLKASDRSRQLDELFNAIGEGVALVDQSGRILKLNNTLKRWSGWYGEAEGRRFSDVIKNIELSQCISQTSLELRRQREQNRGAHATHSEWKPRVLDSIHIDGPEAKRVKAKVVPIEDTRRQGVVILVYLLDVTELHQTEQMRREFFANVSHELKTPIAAIRGYAEVLRDNGENLAGQQAQSFLGVIERNAVELTKLIDEMVTIARLESGALLLELKEYNLRDAVQRVFETCLPKAQQAEVELQQEISADAEWIRVDRQRFDSVLLNLVDNGVKYNRPGGKVRVSTRIQGSEVRIYVEDTGQGIPNSAAGRVFERFFRVDKSHTRLGGGTGLGLAIVKHVVMAHGGRITVKSEYNSGTVFKISMPLSSDTKTIQSQTPL